MADRRQLGGSLSVIADPMAAQQLLMPDMDRVKSITGDVYAQLKEADNGLDGWLMNTCELFDACVATEGSEKEQTNAVEIRLAVQQVRLDSHVEAPPQAKEMAERLGRQLKDVYEAFHKVSQNFPSG